MAGDVLQQVGFRNQFYKDSYRTVLAAFLLSIVVNVALAGLCYYQFTHRPRPAYIATTVDGRILPRQPLTVPIMSDAALLQWAQHAIVASYSYDYIDYVSQLELASHQFSANGWRAFKHSLAASKQLQMVVRDKAIVVATPTGVPTITQHGVLDGRYVWVINMPIMVQYISHTGTTTRFWDVTVRAQRDGLLIYPKGMSISSFVAQEGHNPANQGGYQ